MNSTLSVSATARSMRARLRRRARRHALGVARHLELAVDLAAFGGSALVGDGAIPKDRALEGDHSIPSTYVPARNTVFLSLALAWAEVVGATAIVIGVNALDYSGYPDCRPEFPEAFERMAALAIKAGVEGRLLQIPPLLRLSKADIIRRVSCPGSITRSPTVATTRRVWRALQAGVIVAACERRDSQKPGSPTR